MPKSFIPLEDLSLKPSNLINMIEKDKDCQNMICYFSVPYILVNEETHSMFVLHFLPKKIFFAWFKPFANRGRFLRYSPCHSKASVLTRSIGNNCSLFINSTAFCRWFEASLFLFATNHEFLHIVTDYVSENIYRVVSKFSSKFQWLQFKAVYLHKGKSQKTCPKSKVTAAVAKLIVKKGEKEFKDHQQGHPEECRPCWWHHLKADTRIHTES